MDGTDQNRRDLLVAALPMSLAMLALAGAGGAGASTLNPYDTAITPPDALKWVPNKDYPDRSVDMCPLFGSTTKPGLYYVLMRWWPGYMSAPHFYTSDRLCVVVSGTWWCNSGSDFDPARCVPVQAGSFVRRRATTPHYDGVIAGHDQPAIIAICGNGPVDYALVDPGQPGWRKV